MPTMHMHFWDLGGSPSVRTLWSKYYDESDAVVFAVDARDFLPLHDPVDKGKGKAKAPDAGSEACEARELAWKLLGESHLTPLHHVSAILTQVFTLFALL